MFDEDYDEGFKNMPMYDQLGKIIDSVSAAEVHNPTGRVKDYFRKFNPVTEVVTDDGDVFEISPLYAAKIRSSIMQVPTQSRLKLLKHIQTTEGLTEVLNFFYELEEKENVG